MAAKDQKLSNMRATTCKPTADGGFQMVYHQTTVFRSKPTKTGPTIYLDTGGYHTDTTKRRINWCFDKMEIPVQIFQKNWNWFLCLTQPDGTRETTEFLSDMAVLRFSQNGSVWTMIHSLF